MREANVYSPDDFKVDRLWDGPPLSLPVSQPDNLCGQLSHIPPGASMADMVNPAQTIQRLKIRVADLESQLARHQRQPADIIARVRLGYGADGVNFAGDAGAADIVAALEIAGFRIVPAE